MYIVIIVVYFYRLLGLCLLQNELCPIFLTRHVLKSILGRQIKFHDLAFFDPVVYESLRQLVVDAETKDSDSLFSALDINFTYVLFIVSITFAQNYTFSALISVLKKVAVLWN